MALARPKTLTFEEYLNFDDGPDNRYELVHGELIRVPLPSLPRSNRIDFLHDAFRAEIQREQLPWLVERDVGVRTWIGNSRTPDLCIVIIEQLAEIVQAPSAVLQSPPLLVVEGS
ncbi:Uma2 family endonuclease [Leptolyngbya sp. FACHB-261]|uniref:Uma2 family endonuclease n=1 Tax=Leptolyngbya sp. FACHB-261 TaxID=2692806 RepID=UPI0024116135|nr:Uma2 family endonuclease [Leptolyngbya sp. FACHB-261]